jgi:hypothetical protein
MDRREEARLERLSAYLDGWVTDQERAAVDRELAAEATAREALNDLHLVRTALAHLDTPRAPRSFALSAAPERRPLGLFRRMEWATRGAAGLAALAFTFALVNGPQTSETVTSAVPAAAQERSLAADSAVAPAAAPAGAAPKARETATQTLEATPGAAAAGPTTQGAAASATPTTNAGAAASTPPGPAPAAAPAPAPAGAPFAVTPTAVPASTPAAGGTPAPNLAPAPATVGAPPPTAPTPRVLLAAPPTATPADGAAAGTTPVPTAEATRLATAVPPTPSATPAAAVVAPAPTEPEAKAADSTGLSTAPVTGTLPLDSASEDAGEMGVTPALGVLALLLALLAIIQRAGARPTRG